VLAFQNVLVGIDLSQRDPPGSKTLSPPVREAIQTSVWLAEKMNASLTFFTAIEIPEDTPYLDLLVDEPQDLLRSLAASANDELGEWVGAAQAKGISAKAEVAHGVGWMEIIRLVERDQHDLVIAGARNLHGFDRFLLGSTAQKLLRNCPCPVWVVRPDHTINVSHILVASDLRPVSEKALWAAVELAPRLGAKVHVVHAASFPLERIWLSPIHGAAREHYRRQVRADADAALKEQVARLGVAGARVEIEVIDGDGGADLAILRFIDQHQVDMLVMGTVARHGVPGVLVGNTAERMLHEAPCSLFAVKPDGFESPAVPKAAQGRKQARRERKAAFGTGAQESVQ